MPAPTLADFAAVARALALEIGDCLGRAWIGDIADYFEGMSREDVDAALVEAHRAGLLTLTRCDMPAAFDAWTVENSEVRHLESTYHRVS